MSVDKIIEILTKRKIYLEEAVKMYLELSVELDSSEEIKQGNYREAKEHKARLEECSTLLRKIKGGYNG